MRASSLARIDRLENLVTAALARAGSGDTLAAQLQYTYVYRPGAAPPLAPNVFTTWPALYAATQRVKGPVLIETDSSLAAATVPAGAYSFPDGVTFTGHDFDSTLTFLTGATLTTHLLQIEVGEVATSSTSGPVFTYPDPTAFVIVTNGGFVAAEPGAQPFVRVTAAGAAGMLVTNLVDIGDGTHAVITVDGGATLNMTLGGSSSILAGSLSGAGTINVGRSSDSFVGAQPGLTTLDIIDDSSSATTLFAAAIPGDWAGSPPVNAQDAINRIAHAVRGLLGAPIP